MKTEDSLEDIFQRIRVELEETKKILERIEASK